MVGQIPPISYHTLRQNIHQYNTEVAFDNNNDIYRRPTATRYPQYITYQSYCDLEERPLPQRRQCIEPDVLVSLITFSMIGTYYTYQNATFMAVSVFSDSIPKYFLCHE